MDLTDQFERNIMAGQQHYVLPEKCVLHILAYQYARATAVWLYKFIYSATRSYILLAVLELDTKASNTTLDQSTGCGTRSGMVAGSQIHIPKSTRGHRHDMQSHCKTSPITSLWLSRWKHCCQCPKSSTICYKVMLHHLHLQHRPALYYLA